MFKDYFIFTKGERNALFILIFLIFLSIGIVFRTKSTKEVEVITYEEKDTTTITRRSIYKETNSFQTKNQQGTSTFNKKQNKTHPSSQKKKTHYTPKFSPGTIIELNTADTTTLKRIPGIGSVYANRIVKFRKLLRGFSCIEQLKEVYGMDQERFENLKPWFSIDTSLILKIRVNHMIKDSIKYHPYLSYKQKKAIQYLLQNQSKIKRWEELLMMEEFSEEDLRLKPYLSFE